MMQITEIKRELRPTCRFIAEFTTVAMFYGTDLGFLFLLQFFPHAVPSILLRTAQFPCESLRFQVLFARFVTFFVFGFDQAIPSGFFGIFLVSDAPSALFQLLLDLVRSQEHSLLGQSLVV
jgi:hypothetical protein